jgi:hypothetical protein
MHLDTTWGGQLEIYALSQHLKRSIIVLAADDGLLDKYRVTNSNTIHGTDPIYLYNNVNYGAGRSGSHYEVLYPKDKGIPAGLEHSIPSNVTKLQSDNKPWKCSSCTYDNPNGRSKCEMCGAKKPTPEKKYIHGEDNYAKLYQLLIDRGIEQDIAMQSISDSNHNEDNTMFQIALELSEQVDEPEAIACSQKEIQNMGILTDAACAKRGNKADPTTISLPRLKEIARSCGLNVSGLSKTQLCDKLFK